MIVGPKDLQGHMFTGICIIIIYLLIGKYTIGLKKPLSIIFFLLFAGLEEKKINSIIPYILAFYEKSKANKYGQEADKCINAAMKKFYIALFYFVALPVFVGCIVELVLKFGSNINMNIACIIVTAGMLISYFLINLVYKFEPKEIEFSFYKEMSLAYTNNVAIYYNLAALSALMTKTEECLNALKVVVKLDRKYAELAREDMYFSINDLRNSEAFKEIVR